MPSRTPVAKPDRERARATLLVPDLDFVPVGVRDVRVRKAGRELAAAKELPSTRDGVLDCLVDILRVDETEPEVLDAPVFPTERGFLSSNAMTSWQPGVLTCAALPSRQ